MVFTLKQLYNKRLLWTSRPATLESVTQSVGAEPWLQGGVSYLEEALLEVQVGPYDPNPIRKVGSSQKMKRCLLWACLEKTQGLEHSLSK